MNKSKFEINYCREPVDGDNACTYKITINKDPNKLDQYDNPMSYYIGFQGFPFDPDYKGSAVTNRVAMMKDIQKYGGELLVTGWMKVNDEAIFSERNKLRELNAKDDPNSYNASNGGVAGLAGTDNKSVHDLLRAVEDYKDCFEHGTLPCKDIVAIPHKQVRLEVVVPQNVKGIRERIDDTQGNSVLENKPIPILVDFFGKGKHARIGHKHFVLACVASEFVFDDTELNIVWIPKKEWIKLVDTKQKGDDRYNKLELFGILLNPDNEVTSLPSSKETYANNIFNNYKLNNVVPRHSSNIEILKAGKVPPSKRTAIYELVDKMIAKKTAILKGQFFNDWIGDEILFEKLKKHIENKTSRLAFTKATYLLSNRSLRAFVYHILHEVVEDNPYAQLIHVVIVHATYDDQTEWDTKKLAIVSTKINKWLKAWNTEYKKNVRVEYSPVSISRPKPPMDDSSIDAEAETARKVVI